MRKSSARKYTIQVPIEEVSKQRRDLKRSKELPDLSYFHSLKQAVLPPLPGFSATAQRVGMYVTPLSLENRFP